MHRVGDQDCVLPLAVMPAVGLVALAQTLRELKPHLRKAGFPNAEPGE